MSETVLSVIPGKHEHERLVVAMQRDPQQPLVLRHESFNDAVGWFTQSCVELSPEQVAGLRSALGLSTAGRDVRPTHRSGAPRREDRAMRCEAPHLRLHAASA